MKTKIAIVLIQFGMLAGAGLSQPAASTPHSVPAATLTGIWQGQGITQQAGVPFVTLTISNEGGSLSGAILLSVVHVENGKPVASAPGIPEPILNPSFDGQTLTFQMKYRGPLPPDISSSDPVLTCRLRLSPQNKAELAMGDLVTNAVAITGSPLPLGRPIQMIRSAK